MSTKFRFIDLFAGIGGMRLGFESAGGTCVFTSEWDKFSQQTYRANFDEEEIHGDITQIHAAEIPSHDVIVAGFPCQPFSIAGVSKKNSLGRAHGFLDVTQGTLFFDVARIIDAHRPQAFLLENVKNLVGHDKGRTMEVILRTLTDELGYNVQTRVVNAQGFVPQHRERIFIIGFRDTATFDLKTVPIPDAASGPRLESILHSESGDEAAEPPYTFGSKGKIDPKYVLSEKLWAYLQEYARKHREKGNGFGFGKVGGNDIARTMSARYYKDGSEILIDRGNQRPRRLTPREASRLMGFDQMSLDIHGRPWNIPVSDTQAYRQFGNAVVPQVVSELANAMVPHLGEAGTRKRRPQSASARALASAK